MSYSHAVIDPFNSDAYGAQLPDMYPFPTSTVCLKQSTTLSSNAEGDWDLSVVADPRITLYSNDTDCLAELAQNWSDSDSIVPIPTMTGLLSSGQLENYQFWRVMGLGIRLRSLLVPMTSTGTMVYATLPGPNRVMKQTIQDILAVGEKADLLEWYDFPETDGSGFYATNLENFATASRMDHFQFNSKGFEWSTFAVAPGAWEWRNGYNARALTLNQGSVVNMGDIPEPTHISTGGALSSAQLSSNMNTDRCDGFAALHIRGLNFPASVNVADVEVIMHLEFVDQNTTTTGGNAKFPIVNPNMLNTVAATVSKLPLYRSLPDVSNAAKGQNRLGYN